MASEVVIVDYGSGNVRSMLNALKRAVRPDQEVVLSNDPAVVARAERVVLPGVGAFADCMGKLRASGLLPPLQERVKKGTPFFGVCVGMQILADTGLEFGTHAGLGWVHGVCRKLVLPPGGPTKLPHIGWAPISPKPHPVLSGLGDEPYLYFVHSFFLECSEPADVAATAHYGETFCAAVAKANVFGCQFHPEKSDLLGLKVLENFCRWRPGG